MIQDDYYIETDYNFATDSKLIGTIIKKKPLSAISPKKEKYIETVTEEVIEPIEVLKYKYVKVLSGYRYYYEPIYKYRKVGKRLYFTTEYKRKRKAVYKRKRQYYKDVEYQIKEVTRDVIKYRNVRQRQQEDIQTTKIMYKEYEPLLLWEFYTEQAGNLVHRLYIAPFFEEFGVPYYIANDKQDYCLPSEIPNSKMYKNYVWFCRSLLNKSKMNLRRYDRKTVEQIKSRIENNKTLKTLNLTDTDKCSKDILDIALFTNVRNETNKKVVVENRIK